MERVLYTFMNAAAPSPLPTPFSDTQQKCRAALAKLLELSIGVAEVAARLVEVESRALKVLADAAEAAAQAIMAVPGSLDAAVEAGRVADASDAMLDGVSARMTSGMATFKAASRAVRLTAALALRVEQPMRPVRDASDASIPGKPRVRPANETERQRDNERLDDERLDDAEIETEIGHRPAEAIIRDICRELGLLMAPGDGTAMHPLMPEAVRAILARAGMIERAVRRSSGEGDGSGLPQPPETMPEPDG